MLVQRPRVGRRKRWRRAREGMLAGYAHDAVSGSAASGVMVGRARLELGMKVLHLDGRDRACLALATQVGPRGHVTVIAQRRELLAGVETEARKMGLANLTFRVADAHELPFPDGAFDRVTCRFDATHLADCRRELEEMYRVLKPGGWAAYLERAADRELLSDHSLQPGSLASALKQAGFREVEEQVVVLDGYVARQRNVPMRLLVATGMR